MQFVIFLLVLLSAYYIAGRCLPRFQWCVLLCGSLIFYAFSGWQNFFYMFTVSLSTWAFALLMKRFPKGRRVFLWTALGIVFGILAWLKYWRILFHQGAGILLPLGISFFTFQAAGYLIDSYMGKVEPERNPFRYLLFVSFFPQLIQGPIGRYNQLSKDLYSPKRSLSASQASMGLRQILFGLLKKYALANMLSDTVAYVLDAPNASTPGVMIVLSILLYSVQQYADFSGGIDLVIGVARLFEVNLTPNFRQPYFATSLGDFWRRWHISLGSWMKDYVFYPFALLRPMQKLGKTVKKHCGKHLGRSIVPSIANILVFALVGIWHGAQLHYLYWGLYNGIIIALSDLLSPVFSKVSQICHLPVKSKLFHVFRVLRTFLIVNIGWYLDRIVSMEHVRIALHNTLFSFHREALASEWASMLQSLFVTLTFNKYAFHVAGASLVLVVINSVLCEKAYKTAAPENDPVPFFKNPVVSAIATLLILLSFTLVSARGGFLYANF